MSETTCQLWTEFHPGGGSAPRVGHRFLQFRRSNLLVRLVGPEARDELDEFVLRDTDALGLGLAADDFADGVVICRDDDATGTLGWRCHPVRVLGMTEDGNLADLGDEGVAERWLA